VHIAVEREPRTLQALLEVKEESKQLGSFSAGEAQPRFELNGIDFFSRISKDGFFFPFPAILGKRRAAAP
jgi:hypothetical protein